jgi:Glutamine amidotransferase domain
MCKVFMVAGIKPEKVPMVAKLAKHMAKAMSFIEDDGVGYAAITKDGQVYGEKWLNKDEAFIVHETTPPDPILDAIVEIFGDSVEMDKKISTGESYSSFGERNGANIQNTVAMILHARKSTVGSKTIKNVHPFVKCGGADEPSSTALIHNGSILNHDKLTKQMSDCDSEVILHEYLANQMYHNPWGVEQLAKTLVGQYTVGVLSSQLGDDGWVPYLDIFKSNKDLIGGYVPQLETFVFSTNKYTLEEGLKAAEMTLIKDFKFKDGYLHRINAITGLAIEQPISFTTSPQHMSGYNRNHEHSLVRTRQSNARNVLPYGPLRRDDIEATSEETVESAKKHFERRHPSLFTEPYLEADITPEEKEFFDFLDKDDKTDRKALRLVDAALGRGA